MYIKSIVLDGFKSYGQRTVIEGFDQKFNAITGLNGTGKSNILDSICFVLGISQLSNVRVTSLQDLVYKNGQAGVTKATVTVIFDNRDKNQCPVGFQDYDEITVTRQVVMGGKNRYLLNGINVQNKRVHDLFCSVQLNVNNPHFLIMQGRITKVLNMNPPEILSMVEEAVGTGMYEMKRQTTARIIEKKEAKLQEINQLAKEELIPKLERLREERKIYMEFQLVERELENLTSMYSAWQYVQAEKIIKLSDQEFDAKKREIKEMEDKIERNKQLAADTDKEVEEHEKKDSSTNDKLQELEKNLKEKEKMLANASAAEKGVKSQVADEEKRKKQLMKSIKDDESALASKEGELNELNETFKNLKDSEAADVAAYNAAQKKFEALSAGMDIGDDGEAATLQEQIIKAKQDAAEAANTIRDSTMQLQHYNKQVDEKQKELGSSASDFKKDKLTMENLEKNHKNLTNQLNKLNYDENRAQNLHDVRRRLAHECRDMRARTEHFEAQYPQIEFRYRDPMPNFNRKSVKGLVCKLISIKDQTAAMALETVAGGRLFNVITDTEITSKKLLENGQLKHRTTIIPLNKIKGSSIPPDIVNYAQSLVGASNVRPALSLLNYSKELQPAMEFIFGNAFICRDMDIAKKITFDKRILKKCVTLDGDVTDPSGTLSGGAAKKGGSFLLRLEEYKEIQAQLSAKEQELAKLEAEAENLQKVAETYARLKQEYDLASHQLAQIRARLQQTSHYQQQEEIENLKKTIVELTNTIKACKEREKSSSKKVELLEKEVESSKNNKEKKVKEAEAQMKRLKQQAEKSKKMWLEKEKYYETVKLEITELKKAIENGHTQIEVCERGVDELQQNMKNMSAATEEAKEAVTTVQAQYKEYKLLVSSRNKEIQKKLEEKNNLLAEVSDVELEIKKSSHAVKELEKKCRDLLSKKAELKKKIKKDDSRLKDATELSDRDGQELSRKIAKTEEHRKKLSRNVNMKAQTMFEQEEKEYTKLMNKKKDVESDKKKLLNTMEHLDKTKIDLLVQAVGKISKDFGSIFSTLLPNTDAKLKPPENKNILDGLEIKVSIGGIWRENLSELSGGQKSLVALSLILAMLLYKPAPIYILDEIDSALDLSHTQNIGKMLRMHFKHSQFIIVSLKDGMFNNANVLFRTKFDGVSSVTRMENHSSN